MENGDVMEEYVGTTSPEYYDKNDGAMTSASCINTNSQVIVNDSPDALQQEVSAIKFKLNQHVDETRTEP